jgi:hypothetical protein
VKKPTLASNGCSTGDNDGLGAWIDVLEAA